MGALGYQGHAQDSLYTVETSTEADIENIKHLAKVYDLPFSEVVNVLKLRELSNISSMLCLFVDRQDENLAGIGEILETLKKDSV